MLFVLCRVCVWLLNVGFLCVCFFLSWPRGYKTFFMLNSAEHEIFSANKYENASYCWHYFHAQLCLARKNLQLLVI